MMPACNETRSHHHETFLNTRNLTSYPMLDLLILSILLCFVLGVISGLIIGIHTNNFALILLAPSPPLSDIGFSNIHIAVTILANATTHTLLYIP